MIRKIDLRREIDTLKYKLYLQTEELDTILKYLNLYITRDVIPVGPATKCTVHKLCPKCKHIDFKYTHYAPVSGCNTPGLVYYSPLTSICNSPLTPICNCKCHQPVSKLKKLKAKK